MDDERLHRAPLRWRLPRDRRSFARWSAAAVLLCLAWLTLQTRPEAPPASCARPTGPVQRVGATRPPAGSVGVPLTVASHGAAAVLRAGDHVDVLRADSRGVVVVGPDLRVLVVGSASAEGDTTDLYVAATPAIAAQLASVPDARFTVTVRSS
jgi:hypothetical protein